MFFVFSVHTYSLLHECLCTFTHLLNLSPFGLFLVSTVSLYSYFFSYIFYHIVQFPIILVGLLNLIIYFILTGIRFGFPIVVLALVQQFLLTHLLLSIVLFIYICPLTSRWSLPLWNLLKNDTSVTMFLMIESIKSISFFVFRSGLLYVHFRLGYFLKKVYVQYSFSGYK